MPTVAILSSSPSAASFAVASQPTPSSVAVASGTRSGPVPQPIVTAQQGPAGPEGEAGAIGPAGPGTALPLIASADIGGHRVVRLMPDGTVAYASADDLDDVGEVIGITMGAASAGAPVIVSYAEPITEPSWSFVPGAVFLGFGGALTQAPFSFPAGAFRQQVAIAVSPTSIVVGLGPPLILA